jgi:hypothetical protein
MVICAEHPCKSEASYGFRFAEPVYCRTHGLAHKAITQYQVCKCGESTPRFKLPTDERASCCAKCKIEGMINVADRRCKCTLHLPTYGLPTDKRPEYCKECKKDGMINLKDKNKKCICKSVIPSFGFKDDKKPTCCVKCKQEGMINLLLDLCPCGKSAVFGLPTDTKATFCNTCKKENMVNIITKKCKCGKAVPTFGKVGSKKATHCSACKENMMVNVIAKKCLCGKAQPVFGLPDDKVSTCCKSCKTLEMIDIRSLKCKCGKAQPVFGLPGDKKATCCSLCKTNEMINIKASKCLCGKSQPFFGFPNDMKPICCTICKKEGMNDIVSNNCPNRKCKGTKELQEKGLKCPYDHVGKKKYDYYCTICFEQNFPNDPRTNEIRGKTKEMVVRDFLVKKFPEYLFVHNKPLWTGQEDCTCRRRIDFRHLIGNTLLCIEVDEDQHKYRNKMDEEIRYDDLMMLHGGKFIFIRFNPDRYKTKKTPYNDPPMEDRLKVLEYAINRHMYRVEKEKNTELVEIDYLFYDEI